MKKWMLSLALAAVALGVATSGAAYARSEMAHGGPGDGSGILHDYMVEAFAEALGIPADDLESRLASGETLAEIAADLGVEAEDFPMLWQEARQAAIDAALADGVLTAEQAEWMLSRMQAGMARHAGPRAGVPGALGGMRGFGSGAGTGPCPWVQQ